MPKRQFHAKNQPLKLIIAMTIKPHHPARPLYVPAPVAPVATPDSDFADLPGEEIQVPPSNTAPSTPKKSDAPKRGDALEGLINQVT